jgi:hypothetical protein
MLTIEVWTILAHPLFLDQLDPRAEGEGMTDEQAIEAVKKRRRKLLLSVLEVSLGDLVEMDGIEKVKKYLNEFERQLTEY